MKTKLFRNKIEIRKSSIQGYGVFATHDIKKDSIIEECYTLPVTGKIPEIINYVFSYSEKPEDKKFGLALGYGSIYNHSETPNATYQLDIPNQLVIFKAIQNIKQNEEILVSYSKNWFTSRGVKIITAPPAPKTIYKVLSVSAKLSFILLLMLMFNLLPH